MGKPKDLFKPACAGSEAPAPHRPSEGAPTVSTAATVGGSCVLHLFYIIAFMAPYQSALRAQMPHVWPSRRKPSLQNTVETTALPVNFVTELALQKEGIPEGTRLTRHAGLSENPVDSLEKTDATAQPESVTSEPKVKIVYVISRQTQYIVIDGKSGNEWGPYTGGLKNVPTLDAHDTHAVTTPVTQEPPEHRAQWHDMTLDDDVEVDDAQQSQRGGSDTCQDSLSTASTSGDDFEGCCNHVNELISQMVSNAGVPLATVKQKWSDSFRKKRQRKSLNHKMAKTLAARREADDISLLEAYASQHVTPNESSMQETVGIASTRRFPDLFSSTSTPSGTSARADKIFARHEVCEGWVSALPPGPSSVPPPTLSNLGSFERPVVRMDGDKVWAIATGILDELQLPHHKCFRTLANFLAAMAHKFRPLEDPFDDYVGHYCDSVEWKHATQFIVNEAYDTRADRQVSREELADIAAELVGNFCWDTVMKFHEVCRCAVDHSGIYQLLSSPAQS